MAKKTNEAKGGTRGALQRMRYEAANESAPDRDFRGNLPDESVNGGIMRRMILEQLRQMQRERQDGQP